MLRETNHRHRRTYVAMGLLTLVAAIGLAPFEDGMTQAGVIAAPAPADCTSDGCDVVAQSSAASADVRIAAMFFP